MLRFGILASAVPLVLAGLFAQSELLPGPRPCIEAGGSSLQIAEAPWNADLHVAFTDVPATATVRVQIVESAETADFVMVDGADSAEANACGGPPRFVAISAYPSASAPVIYLSTAKNPRCLKKFSGCRVWGGFSGSEREYAASRAIIPK
jgi:hypothetical protein